MNNNDVFGGHAKKDTYDPALFVSCLHTNCSDFFVYLSNGKVEPSRTLSTNNKTKARYTIDLLKLNTHYLIVQRKKWLDELDQLIDEHLKKGWSLTDLAAIHLEPINHKLYPFFTATGQRFGLTYR